MRFARRKQSKYNNKKCEADGYKFDSLTERMRYYALRAMLDNGYISELVVHPKWTFTGAWIKGDKLKRQATYTADFSYKTNDGRLVVEDVKSKFTAADKYFRFKRAIFERDFGIEIRIVF